MKGLSLQEKYLYFIKVSKKNTSSQVVATFSICMVLMLLKFI